MKECRVNNSDTPLIYVLVIIHHFYCAIKNYCSITARVEHIWLGSGSLLIYTTACFHHACRWCCLPFRFWIKVCRI